jgi:large subunit ribosomal protein L14e
MAKPELLYKRFAEIGRVVILQYGPDAGKLATIVDIVDQNRVRRGGGGSCCGAVAPIGLQSFRDRRPDADGRRRAARARGGLRPRSERFCVALDFSAACTCVRAPRVAGRPSIDVLNPMALSPSFPTLDSLPPLPPRPPQALIDGPAPLTGVSRQVINFKWVALTDYKVKVGRNARQSTLVKAWKEADVQAKWAASAWGKKVAGKITKAASTDFDRFKAKVAHQKVMKKVQAKLPKKA